MANTLNEIRKTVETRLADEFRYAPIIPVIFQNMEFKPDGLTPYIQCLTSFGNSEYLTMGGKAFGSDRIVGLLTIDIFTPEGVGPGDSLVIGERIRNLYNRANVSGVYFDAPIGPELLGTSDEGFKTQVRVTFEYIEVHPT